MTPKEKLFVDYWTEKRKNWSWKKHSSKTFLTIVLPLAVLIDFVNFFIIGDTEYTFFTFSHLFTILFNTFLLSVVIILGSGFTNWNYNEGKYWSILRKNANKLQ